jgi:hypothetical protein
MRTLAPPVDGEVPAMSRPATAAAGRRPRRFRVARSGVVLVAFFASVGLVAAPAIADDERPQVAQADADWPAGWPVDPEAPQTCDVPCAPLHYGLNPDPYIPQSLADLKQSPEPTCSAPALPAPTQAGSPQGYTVPIRIKLTNGVVLSGYSQRAAFRDQPVPFSIVMSGLTGWVVGRVSLPSLEVRVDPGDVHLCDYDRATGVGPLTKAFQSYGYQTLADAIATYRRTGTVAGGGAALWVPFPGTTTVPWPGSLGQRIGGLDNMGVRDAVAQQVEVETSGVAADGSLELGTRLTSRMKTDPAPQNGQPNTVFTCNVNVSGTFGTAGKQIVDIVPPTLPNGYQPLMPARQDKVYLPTRNLTGAVEGGTATVGSNRFDVGIPTIAATRCGGVVNTQFYGYGVYNGNDRANFAAGSSGGGDSGPEGYPIVPGLADMSLDMTVDKIGLPRSADILARYRFE